LGVVTADLREDRDMRDISPLPYGERGSNVPPDMSG
jgi:hypothetical protein